MQIILFQSQKLVLKSWLKKKMTLDAIRQLIGDSFGKLNGVGPVDNRPFTDKLHHFVQKKEKKVTCDMR